MPSDTTASQPLRVLFVDDDPVFLRMIFRIVKRWGGAWQTAYATGGAEALRAVEAVDFDVVVSDYAMPEVNGLEVLRATRERRPGALRVLLSGLDILSEGVEAFPIVHQILKKPCPVQRIRSVVERAHALHGVLSDAEVRADLGALNSLPPLSEVYLALTHALADPTSDSGKVAGLIEQDPALTAKVLQLVNSSLISGDVEVNSISRAVTFLGFNTLRTVILANDTFTWFGGRKVRRSTARSIQSHSMQVANLARTMFDTRVHSETAFTAGLLHDVGKLVMVMWFGSQVSRVEKRARQEKRPTTEIEKEVLGITHAETAAYLLGLWGLPADIVEAVAWHHAPWDAEEPETFGIPQAVYVADRLITQRVERQRCSEKLCEEYLDKLGVLEQLADWRATAEEIVPFTGIAA